MGDAFNGRCMLGGCRSMCLVVLDQLNFSDVTVGIVCKYLISICSKESGTVYVFYCKRSET